MEIEPDIEHVIFFIFYNFRAFIKIKKIYIFVQYRAGYQCKCDLL